jgi:xanthine dehydrogenase accessory factor
MSDLTFYKQLKYKLEIEPVVLATIVKVIGSAPREVGAKMAVCADGSIIGTIGGGAGEGKVIDEALKVLETGTKQLVEIDLTGAPGKDIQGVCGGKVQIWLAKWKGIDAIALSEKILTLFKSGQSGKLITPLEKDTQPYLIGDRDFSKKLPYSSAPYAKRYPLGLPLYSPAQFIETIQPPPTLLIIGGGHVALSLAQISCFAGFEIAVQDDRPEFSSAERFPQAAFLSQSMGETLDNFATHQQLYWLLEV